MKSSIKKMSALLTMMAVAILTFTFTACSDDDDPVTEVTYTYGFSSMSASHPDFLEEMGKIENAFQSALGITGKLFTKKGTIEDLRRLRLGSVPAEIRKAMGKMRSRQTGTCLCG